MGKTINSMAPMFAWQPICNTILGAHALRLIKILENVSPLLKLFFYVKFFNEIINCSVISLVSRSHINIPKLHIIMLFLNDGNTNLINVDPILLAFSTQTKEISM